MKPLTPDPTTHKRKSFPASVKKARLEFSGGFCEAVDAQGVRCTVDVILEKCEYDHDTPDWYGGASDFANCRALCVACHKAKTKREAPLRAKAKRIWNKAHGIETRKHKVKMHSRPFRKDGPKRKIQSRPFGR